MFSTLSLEFQGLVLIRGGGYLEGIILHDTVAIQEYIKKVLKLYYIEFFQN